MGRKNSAKGQRKRSGKGGKSIPESASASNSKVVGLSSEGYWNAASEPTVGGVRLYGNSKLPSAQNAAENTTTSAAPVTGADTTSAPASASAQPSLKVAPADRQLLDACKSGNADGVRAALRGGASATLGLKFMFKVIDLFDKDVTTEIVLLLKEAQKEEAAVC
eukprot:m.363434 g.363434  ORF g.363434 m.363434 type:complete len:164 (-) comp20800_c2_seq2:126-617(-)